MGSSIAAAQFDTPRRLTTVPSTTHRSTLRPSCSTSRTWGTRSPQRGAMCFLKASLWRQACESELTNPYRMSMVRSSPLVEGNDLPATLGDFTTNIDGNPRFHGGARGVHNACPAAVQPRQPASRRQRGGGTRRRGG